MPDMLVKLYDLPDNHDEEKRLASQNIIARRPIAPEKFAVVEWVKLHFGNGWASECDVSFSQNPPNCFIALDGDELVGFACYDTTVPDYFGPTGVDEKCRGKGIGKLLLFKAMEGLRDKGYAYAIIGSAGPKDFYKKLLGATIIEDSDPGIYKGMLRLK